MFLASSACTAAWVNSVDLESLLNTIVTSVCNQYPMLTLHITGLGIYNGKSVIIKNWNIVREKRTTMPILVHWDTKD